MRLSCIDAWNISIKTAKKSLWIVVDLLFAGMFANGKGSEKEWEISELLLNKVSKVQLLPSAG